MDAGSCKQFGIALDHHGSHRAASGETRDIHSIRINVVIRYYLLRHAGKNRWFAAPRLLVPSAKPIPAFGGIGGGRLDWVHDHEPEFIRERIHAGTRSKIVSVLRTAVQHDDERHPSVHLAPRLIKLVGTFAGLIAELSNAEIAHRCRRFGALF